MRGAANVTRTQVWDYREEYAALRDEVLAAVDSVFASGQLILGERVARFEAELSTRLGLAHGIGVGTGTDALFLALRALGVGPGDEVITVSFTAVPTVAAIASTGASPVFVDVHPKTLLMDPGALRAALSERTRCIIPVHLYGQCAPMAEILQWAGEVAVLEDCAQSTGASRADRSAGSFGRAAALSFYPTKVLGAYGDGGMIVTDDPTLAERCRALRMYGMRDRYVSEEHGYNSRLDEVQAAILSVKLAHLDADLRARRQLAGRYDEALRELPLERVDHGPIEEHAFYLYVVRHPERDRILRQLRERDIHLNASYAVPVHRMAPYAGCRRVGGMEATDGAASEVFSLPMYPTLGEERQTGVIDALQELL